MEKPSSNNIFISLPTYSDNYYIQHFFYVWVFPRDRIDFCNLVLSSPSITPLIKNLAGGLVTFVNNYATYVSSLNTSRDCPNIYFTSINISFFMNVLKGMVNLRFEFSFFLIIFRWDTSKNFIFVWVLKQSSTMLNAEKRIKFHFWKMNCEAENLFHDFLLITYRTRNKK